MVSAIPSKRGVQYPRMKRLTVSAVGSDGLSVNLTDGTGIPVNGVLCLSSYSSPSVGDSVAVIQFGPSTASWIVLGAYGTVSPDYVTPDALNQAINAINIPNVPPTVSITQGTGAPSGSGWTQATSLPYVRDDGGGARSVYFPTGGGGGSTPPPPPSPKVPNPVTVSPVSGWSFRPGGQSDNALTQGAWSGTPWTAALFYGAEIMNAIGSNSVKSMHLTLARQNDSSGWNRAVAVHIGTHGHASKTPTTSLNNISAFQGLQHGQQQTYTLTPAQTSALKTGADVGIGMGGGTMDYLKFTGGSGNLQIVFQ